MGVLAAWCRVHAAQCRLAGWLLILDSFGNQLKLEMNYCQRLISSMRVSVA